MKEEQERKIGFPIAAPLNYKKHNSYYYELHINANCKYDKNFINLYEWFKERGEHIRKDGTEFSEEVITGWKNT